MYREVFVVCILLSLGFSLENGKKKRHQIMMDPELNPELTRNALKIEARMGQYMDLTCPQYDSGKKRGIFLFFLYAFNDDYESYKRCDLEGKTVVLECIYPFQTTKLTMKFQRYSPYPLGFTFKDGRTYYYLAMPVNETDCSKAIRLEVAVGKKDVVVPSLKPVSQTDKPHTTTTTTTTKKRATKPTTTTLISKLTTHKTGYQSQRDKGGKGGNGTSNTRSTTIVTTLLGLFILWINL